MLEIVIFIVAMSLLAKQAKQRAIPAAPVILLTSVGFGIALLIGPVGIILRWLVVIVAFVCVQFLTHVGQAIGESWQCPDCRMYNDPETLRCLCGYQHPDAKIVGGTPQEPTGVSSATESGTGTQAESS